MDWVRTVASAEPLCGRRPWRTPVSERLPGFYGRHGGRPLHAKHVQAASDTRQSTLDKALGLLTITPHSNPHGGNAPNEFDIGPFVALLEEADAKWQEKQQARRESAEQTT